MLGLDLCKNSDKFKDTTIFLLYRKNGNLTQAFKECKIEKQHISVRNKVDILFLFRLRAYFKKNSIDVIHAHQPIDAFFSFIASYGLKIKIVCSHHGFIPGRINRFLLRFIVNVVDKNLFVSNSCLTLYTKYLKRDRMPNAVVIYNGVDVVKFDVAKSDVRKELGIGERDLIMGMVGNFYIDARDQLTICKALPAVFEQINNAHFIFIGGRSAKNPEYFDRCYDLCTQNGIQNRVHFLGLRQDIPQLLKNMDLFVYSSAYETFGISLVEAMISGLPCITNDIDTLLEILDNGKYGICVQSKNPEALTTAIISMNSDRNYMKSLGVLGKEYALKEYTIESHIKSLNDLYTTLEYEK